MIPRLIDNASTVQRDLFEFGVQTHAAGAVNRSEQHKREREDQEQQADSFERHRDRDEAFEQLLQRAQALAETAAVAAGEQLALPGDDFNWLRPGGRSADDPRGRQLDLEA